MAAVNLQEYLIGYTKGGLDFVEKDLRALGDDKLAVSPGSKARAPIDFVVECGGFNAAVALFLTTGEKKWATDEEHAARVAELDTVEKALAFLGEQTDAVIAAIKTLEDDQLGDPREFFPFPMTLFEVASLPGHHMNYHDGQLCYIQSLNGDDKMHWF